MLTVIAGITSRPILFVLGGLLAFYLLVNVIYERALTKLILHNKKQTLRLFPEDKETLIFHFHNPSFFPFLNGTLRFNMGEAITINKDFKMNREHQFELPLALISKGKTRLHIPVRALKRGTAKIYNISYSFPHLFKFHPITLAYLPFSQTEVIVYPYPLHISGVKQYAQVAAGTQRSKLSPFIDQQERIGTRDTIIQTLLNI